MGFFTIPKAEDILKDVERLISENEFSKASQVLSKAEQKNIFHEDFHLHRAQIFGISGDRENLIRSLQKFIDFNEGEVLQHIRAIEFISALNHPKIAKHFVEKSKSRFPMSGYPHSAQAMIHCQCGEYGEAASALLQKQKYGKLSDTDIDLVHHIRKGVQSPMPASVEQLFASEQVHEILRRFTYGKFESLGTNCDFGFIQRSHGKEPLSLFRWGTMPRLNMMRLFQNRFEGFALPSSSELIANSPTLDSPDESLEYYFHDSGYEFTGHSHIGKKTIDFDETEEVLLEKLRNHFFLLARKLQEDLEDAEKIFVYQSKEGIDDQQCIEFHDALCTSGNNKLLVAILDQEGRDQFKVLRPNLIVGSVSGWGGTSNYDPQSDEMQRWDHLIQSSYSHFLKNYPELEP